MRRTTPAAPSADDPAARELRLLIAAFERRCGARLCVYDYVGRLAPWLPAAATFHDHPFCRHVNRCTRGRCGRFDHLVDAPAAARLHGDGFAKRCHGDVVEVCAPIWADGGLAGLVMAGQFAWRSREPMPGPQLTAAGAATLDAAARRLHATLPTIDGDGIAELRVLLRALAARIEQMLAERQPLADAELPRRWRIEHLIGRRFAQDLRLADVARHLGMSASRARRVVREVCGVGFAQLLLRRRIEHARDLLARSDLPVARIASACGFSAAAAFHRAFRRNQGMTPLAYRATARR